MNFVPCCKTLSFFQLFKYPCTFRRKMRPIDGFKLQIICRLTKLKCGKKFNNFVFRSIFQVDGSLHLKSFLNMAGPGVISVGAGPEAQSILKRMEREATHRYQTLTLPEDRAANCLFVNGTLIHRSKAEAPKSDPVRTHRKQIWRRIIHYHDFSLLSFFYVGFLCQDRFPADVRVDQRVLENQPPATDLIPLHTHQEVQTCPETLSTNHTCVRRRRTPVQDASRSGYSKFPLPRLNVRCMMNIISP